MKVVTILGTRPEIIRLSEIIKKCDEYFDHILVHTGQNYDYRLNEVFFNDLRLREPDHYLNVAGNSLGETIGNVISKSYDLLVELKPDALIVLGDTNSVLSTISAKRLKIPIFHLEAGNRCFDQNVPEETNRKISDHIADINLAYTENSRRYLLAEGFRGDHIFVVGSPLREILDINEVDISESKILDVLGLEKNKFIVISAHREENVDLSSNFEKLVKAINGISVKYSMPVIFSVHPRTRKRIETNALKFHENVRLLDPFGFFDYVKLQQNAYIVLSDSGTISEESAMMSFPAVSIRTSTERPEAIDAGSIVLGGITESEMESAIEITKGMFDKDKIEVPMEYKFKNTSERVVKVVEGFTKVINKVVWYK